MLFTSKTCPNCPSAKQNLDNRGIRYRIVDAMENEEMAKSYGIMSVPTFIPNPEEKTYALHGVSEIIGWANRHGSSAK
ncbi:MAG: thioredoxin family protein [Sphaerochaetaceae bacterium]|nr:thioredoxin family protein [Sphaerochaetaceae bacterium]